MAAIAAGDTLPDATLLLVTPDTADPIRLRDWCASRRTVLFAVPGAFTPTCTANHLPGFLEQAEALAAAGVAATGCVAVNDPFVLRAWAAQQGVAGRLDLFSDGAGTFTRAIGLEIDLSERFFGIRSRRWAAILDNGRVTYLGVEPGRDVGVSGVDAVLERLAR